MIQSANEQKMNMISTLSKVLTKLSTPGGWPMVGMIFCCLVATWTWRLWQLVVQKADYGTVDPGAVAEDLTRGVLLSGHSAEVIICIFEVATYQF